MWKQEDHDQRYKWRDMRNKQVVKIIAMCKCPKDSCGFEYEKKFNIEFVRNQKGDIIEHKILNY